MTEETKKIVFKEEIKCPHCRKFIDITKQKILIEAGIAAQWKESLNVKKAEQKKLDDYKKKKK